MSNGVERHMEFAGQDYAVAEYDWDFPAPITEDTMLTIQCNSVVLQNMGNVAIILNEGYTLLPGATIAVGDGGFKYRIDRQIKIRFDGRPITVDPVTGAPETVVRRRLEQAIVKIKNPLSSNLTRQSIS